MRSSFATLGLIVSLAACSPDATEICRKVFPDVIEVEGASADLPNEYVCLILQSTYGKEADGEPTLAVRSSRTLDHFQYHIHVYANGTFSWQFMGPIPGHNPYFNPLLLPASQPVVGTR